MKKTLIIITLLVVSIGFCLAQVMIPDWQTMKLKGEVKILITTSFEAQKQGDSIANKDKAKGDKTKARQNYTYCASEQIRFNEDGYIQNVTGTDKFGKNSDYINFKYKKPYITEPTKC